jgi:hypothetical protein
MFRETAPWGRNQTLWNQLPSLKVGAVVAMKVKAAALLLLRQRGHIVGAKRKIQPFCAEMLAGLNALPQAIPHIILS